jgi:hypothetical protein
MRAQVFALTLMHHVWSGPHHISPRLQFLLDNSPAADPAKVINVTCGGPHIENVLAGRMNEIEYVNTLFFSVSKAPSLHIHVIHNEQQCILKQCSVWKH